MPIDPREGPVRVAFAGRFVEDGWAALTTRTAALDPVWIEHGELAERLATTEVDVLVVFRPERIDPAVVARAGVPALAVLPDPLDLPWGEFDVWDTNARFFDEAVALQGGRDALVAPFDATAYARVIAADPLVARVAPDLGLWRCPPLPVDDRFFLGDRPPPRPPRPLFLGESTERREDLLVWPKHGYELSHYAHGLAGDRLQQRLEATNVGITLHPGFAGAFPPKAPLHLAAGHLLITQPLRPSRGLEPGLDHVQVEAPDQIMRVLDQLRDRPAAYERVRIRGRFRAEEFRASTAWARLLGDLADDLRAFG